MKDLIGYCGIDCEKCNARIATVNKDEKLRKETAELWSKLNGVEIPTEAMYCLGCRTEGVKTYYCDQMCAIRKCAEKKKLCSCGLCKEWKDCTVLQPIREGASGAKENLASSKR